MTVSLNPNLPDNAKSCTKSLCKNPSSACMEKHSRSLHIGLINNMPDGALDATERQFLALLDSASEGLSVSLSFYSLPGVPRSEAAEQHMRSCYTSAENLFGTTLDGLIVTGREPMTPNLQDEPYWNTFTQVLEWARNNTLSTVWSCLAAHAAVLHMDGIKRIKSDHKQCGIFDCEQLAGHALTAGMPSSFNLPHSRWNGLPEEALTASGYEVLTRSADAGVDTFVKQQNSLFVFFQGHPEYESHTLLLEYRRDVGRYLRGETNTYPLLPRNYFPWQTAAALAGLQQQAMSCRREELLAEVSNVLSETRIETSWHPTAAGVYKNWLEYIAAQKKQQLLSRVLNLPAMAAPAAVLETAANSLLTVEGLTQ